MKNKTAYNKKGTFAYENISFFGRCQRACNRRKIREKDCVTCSLVRTNRNDGSGIIGYSWGKLKCRHHDCSHPLTLSGRISQEMKEILSRKIRVCCSIVEWWFLLRLEFVSCTIIFEGINDRELVRTCYVLFFFLESFGFAIFLLEIV